MFRSRWFPLFFITLLLLLTCYLTMCTYIFYSFFVFNRIWNESIVSVSFRVYVYSFLFVFFSFFNVLFHSDIHSPIRPGPIISYNINSKTFFDINKKFHRKKHISSTTYVIFIAPYIRMNSVDSVWISLYFIRCDDSDYSPKTIKPYNIPYRNDNYFFFLNKLNFCVALQNFILSFFRCSNGFFTQAQIQCFSGLVIFFSVFRLSLLLLLIISSRHFSSEHCSYCMCCRCYSSFEITSSDT